MYISEPILFCRDFTNEKLPCIKLTFAHAVQNHVNKRVCPGPAYAIAESTPQRNTGFNHKHGVTFTYTTV